MRGPAPGPVAGPVSWARRALDGVRWYLREIGGDARYDEHVRHCREQGHLVPTRRAFERSRTDARAAVPGARCC